MSDTVAAIALSIAVIGAIVGLLFFRIQIWDVITRKTPYRSYDAPIGGPGEATT